MFVRKEQPLREEMVELYCESCRKAKESLDRLGIDSKFLEKLNSLNFI